MASARRCVDSHDSELSATARLIVDRWGRGDVSDACVLCTCRTDATRISDHLMRWLVRDGLYADDAAVAYDLSMRNDSSVWFVTAYRRLSLCFPVHLTHGAGWLRGSGGDLTIMAMSTASEALRIETLVQMLLPCLACGFEVLETKITSTGIEFGLPSMRGVQLDDKFNFGIETVTKDGPPPRMGYTYEELSGDAKTNEPLVDTTTHDTGDT